MLEKKQFYWAIAPRSGRTNFALVFDAVAQQFAVAVVAPFDRNIKTVLTLGQFEQTYFVVSSAVKLLARLALLAGTQVLRQPVVEAPAATKVSEAAAVTEPLAWRFVVARADGSETSLPVLRHASVCERFLFLFPVSERLELKRRATRVLQTTAFMAWFAGELKGCEIPFEDVVELKIQAVSEAGEAMFETSLTNALVKVLQQNDPSVANREARTAGRHAQQSYNRYVKRTQNASRTTSYAVDLALA
jgi:hypothetical protein